MKVIFSLFFIFLYCKQSAANDLWTIDKNISSIEFEVPVLLTKNVVGKFNEFDGFVSLDLSNQNNDEVFVFNGWMFSSSPSITPFDHPIYDVWLIKCY